MNNDNPANVTFADIVKTLDIKLFENLALHSSILQLPFLILQFLEINYQRSKLDMASCSFLKFVYLLFEFRFDLFIKVLDVLVENSSMQ